MECYDEVKKPVWIVRWHIAYDPHSYFVRFEEWVGTVDGKALRFTKIEPKMREWKCEEYTEKGIEELATLLFTDKPTVVFATGKIPNELKEILRRLPPSTYYLAVV
jgi:hypothetical protein